MAIICSETDREVDELTRGSNDLSLKDVDSSSSCDGEMPSHLPAESNLTAASVAAFMRKVNRIRFNTVNIINKANTIEEEPQMSRPRSCPDLESNSRGSSPKLSGSLPRASNGRFMTGTMEPKRVEFSFATSSAVVTLTSSAMCKSTNTIASQTSFCLTTHEGGSTEVEGQDWEHYFPYEHLFPLVLPHITHAVCPKCPKPPVAETAVKSIPSGSFLLPGSSE